MNTGHGLLFIAKSKLYRFKNCVNIYKNCRFFCWAKSFMTLITNYKLNFIA